MGDYRFAILGLGWILFSLPFIRVIRTSKPEKVDRRARWGVMIQGLGYAVIWYGPFWFRTPEAWEVAAGALFFVVAHVLAWTATGALGRHWRVEAGLSPDHELVRSGPYRFIRHPIYAAMMAMLLGTGFLIAPLVRIPFALAIFIVGTEIRVHIEDALLASRFGETFHAYQRNVAAYIPFVR